MAKTKTNKNKRLENEQNNTTSFEQQSTNAKDSSAGTIAPVDDEENDYYSLGSGDKDALNEGRKDE